LRLGAPVEITAYAYPEQKFKGEVEEIADYVGAREIEPNKPAVNLGLKVIQTRIKLLEQTPLKRGMAVDIRIELPLTP
jgi:multidrug resistance efflux pump